MIKRWSLAILIVFPLILAFNQASPYKLARLKYNGGGDWYGNRTALSNLIAFSNNHLKTNIHPEEAIAEVGSSLLFQYPFIYMTGHGNVEFSTSEAKNLRDYLISGGFLHIDDNYGLDKYIRPQMKKVFPELDFVELPSSHPIYHQMFNFPGGLPKIHEHDGKRPQGLGLIFKGRLVCYYTHESDLGNGWEDAGTYPGDTEATRLKALRMGSNILQFAFSQ